MGRPTVPGLEEIYGRDLNARQSRQINAHRDACGMPEVKPNEVLWIRDVPHDGRRARGCYHEYHEYDNPGVCETGELVTPPRGDGVKVKQPFRDIHCQGTTATVTVNVGRFWVGVAVGAGASWIVFLAILLIANNGG